MIYDIQHFFFHCLVYILITRLIYGIGRMQARQFNGFLGPQPVKFQPHIFPGKLPVRDIGTHLTRKQQKTLSAFHLIGHIRSFAVVCNQLPRSGETQMEQVMVSGGRAEGMGRVSWQIPETWGEMQQPGALPDGVCPGQE